MQRRHRLTSVSDKDRPPEQPSGSTPDQPDITLWATGGSPQDPDATLYVQESASAVGRQQAVESSKPEGTLIPGDGYLPIGYRLEQFEVRERLGQGGFSVVYKVYDHRLQTYRALKEYMPRGFAVRGTGAQVLPRSKRDREIFEIGLRSFVAEGVTLAKFDHASLVRVYQNIDANGTAYMVMQLLEGATLESVVDEMGSPPDEAWLIKLLDPLTAALQVVHEAGVVHRDIKPENVMLLTGSRRPLLLDFGAARQVIDRAGPPTGILTPGYAPLEQYPDSGLEQGPWTDIYALAATMYRLLTGNAPPNALARQMKDSCTPLAAQLGGKYSAGFLQALDNALAVDPKKRPQSIAQFRAGLGIDDGAAAPTRPSAHAAGKALKRMSPAVWAVAAGLTVVIAAAIVFLLVPGSPTPVSPSEQVASPAPPLAPSAPEQMAPTTAVPPPPAPGLAPASRTASPIEPGAAFDRIVQEANPQHQVKLALERSELKVNVTPLRLRLNSSMPGWYYVLIHDTDSEVRVLFPAAGRADNRIRPGVAITLPPRLVDPATGVQSIENMPFGEPTGPARLLAIVSDTPLDFAAATLREEGGFRLLLQGAAAEAAATAQPEGRALYLGVPRCPSKGECNGKYGAASVSFRVIP